MASTASVLAGVRATPAMVLHESPDGVVSYRVLPRSGFTGRAAMYARLPAAATTPLGVLVSHGRR
jgi:zinc and cadmium transporter